MAGGRHIIKFRFAHNIELMGGTSSELQNLTNILYSRAGIYGMEVSTKKCKSMVPSTNNTKP
ncbi:hypothetical protein DPMN_192768 [Dreissena polymorpha]|uniref:Uncharacterized protein n=1 Tax=Dreissena polymorpha TaxID=45954 RepID=A0A9D3XZQ6_DREPO|nr:hypothetical protein DPMN_192768 [Dreissena polymorpha]